MFEEFEEKKKQSKIFDDNWFDLIENAITEYQIENNCIGMVALGHCLNMSEYIEEYLKEKLKSKYLSLETKKATPKK